MRCDAMRCDAMRCDAMRCDAGNDISTFDVDSLVAELAVLETVLEGTDTAAMAVRLTVPRCRCRRARD